MYRTPSKRRFSATENRNTTGLKSEEEKAAWRSKQTELEKWLANRKAEAIKIDPDTAEVDWEYGQTLDPYGVCVQTCQTNINKSDEYFVLFCFLCQTPHQG